MILRLLYSSALYLLTPYIKYYLRKRARTAPAYLHNQDERFGSNFSPIGHNVIWIHAVSVGETRAAIPLIQAIRNTWPDSSLLITQMTPTGRKTAEELFGDFAEIRYLPYDYPHAVRRFFKAYQPKFGILMETEIWPNLITTAARNKVPIFLANARLSEKSYKGYARIGFLIKPVFRKLTAISAQSSADCERIKRLGGNNVSVCGNTKYDVTPSDIHLKLGLIFKDKIGSRKVVVCASTRDGEEELILQAWKNYPDKSNRPLLVIVPRHPERFVSVSQLAEQLGYTVQLRSDQQVVAPDTDIWVGDSLGEMFAYYKMADLVFMGGSLLSYGGQNLIEPAILGVPVIMGSSTYNFEEASQLAFSYGAAKQIKDVNELISTIDLLLKNDSTLKKMQAKAIIFSTSQRGASEKIINLIRGFVS